ncbi:hypothetical protein GCM10020229_26720 [Kitasatospora albolonga]|uniref:hypothetical protein n=1 Tax=Kitasatospora albolonga TaxID=68173 RepID=UPI0031E60437
MTSNGRRTVLARWAGPPPGAPRRTAWQRFNRPGTDSGWLLLGANFGLFAFLGLRAFVGVLQGSVLLGLLALACGLGAARAGYVMWRVAGRRGRST